MLESKDPITLKETKEITLTAVGDILIHDRVYDDAETEKGYDFMPMLKRVTPFLNDTTITFANQETMIGGEKLGLSGYPAFNSPTEIGDALKEVGVDVVSIANNHTLDRGEDAIQSAIGYWDKIGMMYVGAYQDQEDHDTLRVYETEEGVSVAFLAYTYGTNGIKVPKGKDYLINYIDKNAIAKAIDEAQEKADVTVLSLHFGEEYERMPNQEQKELVQFAADRGVEIVLGHHPHVLQPVEWVEGKDGNKTFVIYSLGNFLSGQYETVRRIGGMVKITIKQTVTEDEETIEVIDPAFLLTYVHDDDEHNYEIIPMYELTDDVLKDADNQYQEMKDHMSQWMPELKFLEGE
jgi:poly-gamma-glutamate synthesis protein (capsule biosynthesis protein)